MAGCVICDLRRQGKTFEELLEHNRVSFCAACAPPHQLIHICTRCSIIEIIPENKFRGWLIHLAVKLGEELTIADLKHFIIVENLCNNCFGPEFGSIAKEGIRQRVFFRKPDETTYH